ncbi:hypothetical protein MBEHAL_1943 [Halarchaeum acidiphilum MH1-52-1]|uniref:MarR family transcriptional regulator n=1 Tax=Halarchaeum acidiphilum MH1-52-1 TaxID=1261545 RepID=U3AEI0_9EURY|nr:hypothetical protein [Halarchaeum acidiphilum]GAD53183.1 hypothetical protein MBEHAL_1943 [Halarchaeum acidiphilum MH1-52-1]
MSPSEVEQDVHEALVEMDDADEEWGLRDLAARAEVATDGYGMQLCERCLNRLEARGRVEWNDGTWRPAEE